MNALEVVGTILIRQRPSTRGRVVYEYISNVSGFLGR